MTAAVITGAVVSFAQSAPPPNDVCGGAEVVPAAGPFPYRTSIVPNVNLATNSTGEPTSVSCNSSSHSLGVWYKFTPAVSGTYTFSTCGSESTVVDTVIAVYSSSTSACGGTLTQVSTNGCDDDGCGSPTFLSVTQPALTAGTTYFILVWEYGSAAAPAPQVSSLQLVVDQVNPPANDACAGVAPVTLTTPVQFTSYTATDDFQAPTACFTGVGQTSTTATGRDSVWSFNAPSTGKYTFHLRAQLADSTNPVLYVATSCPSTGGQVTTCTAAANRRSTAGDVAEEVSCLSMNQGDTVYVYTDETTTTTPNNRYTLEVTPCLQQESEGALGNGTVATANTLNACGLTGSISPAGDVDYFALPTTPPASSRLFATIDGSASGSSGDYDLRVGDAVSTVEYDNSDNDTRMGSSAPNLSGTPLTGAPAYLRVNINSASSVGEPYRLYAVVQPPLAAATVENEAFASNNSIASALMSTYAYGTLSGTSPSTDVDYYAFEAKAGEFVFVGLDGDPTRNLTPLDAAFAVYDPNGQFMHYINDSGSSSSGPPATPSPTATAPTSPGESLVFVAPATGTYFVRVFTTSSSSTTGAGDYLLSISRNCLPSIAVTSVTPNVGSPNGGTVVTVTGANFNPTTGFTVTIGGIAVTPTSATSTQIVFTTPAHASGFVNIVITNPDGTRGYGLFKYAPPPAISTVTPNSGTTLGGTSVTIAGTDFQTGATVKFGTATATVTNLTATSITVTTPPNAAGPVNVTVTNTDGQTGTKTNGYTYVAPPAITSLTPNNGVGGDTTVITGTAFQAGAAVTFGGVAATSLTVDSPTQITAVVPGHVPGAVDVKVTNPDNQSNTLTNGWTYNALGPAPTVDTLTPDNGSDLGGTSVVIGGTGFINGAAVFFGNTQAAQANVTVNSATQITVSTPAHAFGTVDVTVRNPDFLQGNKPAAYTFVHAPPTVTAIAPAGGNVAGGTNVTLTGSNYLNGASFTVGGVPATNVVVVNATTITGTTGAHPAGLTDVIVTNADMQTATLANGYLYAPPPAGTAITPNHGTTLGGETVTITGTDFQNGVTVTFGTVAGTNVTVVSPTQLTVTTPVHTAGAVNVVITNPDNQKGTMTNAFTFIAPPVATSITPNAGPTTGGTNVKIFGANYVTGATVTIGGTAATNVAFVNGNQLTATTPVGNEGAADVVVTNPDGQASTITAGFTYVSGPTLTSINPTSGTTIGGTQVTLNGDKFTQGATVFFGSKQVTATFVNGQQLTAVAPPANQGVVDVTVKNADGQTATLPNAFTYIAPPTLASITPKSGGAGGGTMVTLTGIGFLPGATVTFGTDAATGVTVVDGSTVKAAVPAHAPGFVDVTLSNPDGQTTTLFQAFQYVPGPVITSIAPVTGSVEGGTQVTITGTDFAFGAKVTFGGVAATNTVFQNATTIVATTPAHAVGSVDVTLTNPDGQVAQLPMAFGYVGAGPNVTLVSPAFGPGDGNTPVLISGSGFQKGATVKFGDADATDVVFVDANSLTARTPRHAKGKVDVVVTNPDGVGFTAANAFTYTSNPTEEVDAGQGGPITLPDAGTPDAGALEYTGGSTGLGCSSTDGTPLVAFAILGFAAMLSRRRKSAR